MKNKLANARNEKDVENIFRNELSKVKDSSIISPYGTDGLFKCGNIRTLLEFKYSCDLKNKLTQSDILGQCLLYLKKFETNGDKMPSTIFVGDNNEVFCLHTNDIIKYLSLDIDWSIAPSSAKKNSTLIQALVNDVNILPFVYNIDENFKMIDVLNKIKELTKAIVKKVKVSVHNIEHIYKYFLDEVIGKNTTLSSNELANLFIQIIINPNENYLHPNRKNTLVTKAKGDITINSNLFKSFFAHFEGFDYSPSEKEQLTACVDRMIEDVIRRNKGEFFTPTLFVDKAHEYLSDVYGTDWKERFVVWDNSAGTHNLTRDYKFKELYTSTLEQSDIDTANQMGYNMEATKFQYDFLNDTFDKLPQGLQDAIDSGKEILFLINPPYATAGNAGSNDTHKAGVANTIIGKQMKDAKWGSSSQNLYAQFLYRIWKFQQINKNIHIGIFCPTLFLTGGSYKDFRKNFLNSFKFEKGFLFQASHFADVKANWGINFAIFSNNKSENVSDFNFDLVDVNKDSFDLEIQATKDVYNVDNSLKASDWVRQEVKKHKDLVLYPHLSSSLKVSDKDNQRIVRNSLGSVCFLSNSVYKNSVGVSFFSSIQTQGNASISISVLEENLLKCTSLFTARKSIVCNWINSKDEYLAPNEQHENYRQFEVDSLIYSLFHSGSNQSSLRQVDYKGKKWDIKNEFFWLSKEEMLSLANDNNFDEMYQDVRTDEDRHVYNLLFKQGLYNELSEDAKEILDMATDLIRKSFTMRKMMSEAHSEYHLQSWDCGFAQLKLVWQQYFKDDYKVFRDKYKAFENRLIPQVYELGFLKQ